MGEVELFLRLVDIILSFLLADVLAACHYREKLSGIDTCFRNVPVLLQHLVQIHISLFRICLLYTSGLTRWRIMYLLISWEYSSVCFSIWGLGTTTVSYTHLDVYKRQGQGFQGEH